VQCRAPSGIAPSPSPRLAPRVDTRSEPSALRLEPTESPAHRAPARALLSVAAAGWLALACSTAEHPSPDAGAAGPAPTVAQGTDSLAGWFHVVWGDGEEYLLVTGGGETVRLVLEPSVRDSVPDPLTLDRRPVSVLGRRDPERPEVMRVSHIRPRPQ
jgi:hypothetical protein